MLPSAESIQIILPVLTVLFLIFSLVNPVYGVIAYFIILNAKLGDMYPSLGEMRFELVVAVIVLLRIFIGARGVTNILPRKNPINSAYLAMFLVGMLSVAFSIDPAISWSFGGYNLLRATLFYVMVVTTIKTRSELSKVLWAFILVAGWTAYEPVSNYLSGNVLKEMYGGVAYGRFGVAAGHVALANVLNESLPITIYFGLASEKRYLKAISGVILIFLIFGVYASKSRGGLVGLFIISMGLLYFAKNRAKAGMIIGLLFIFLMGFAASDYLTHMSTIKHGIYGSKSSTDRFIGLLNGLSMLEKRPVIGVGIGCYPEARKRYFHYYFYSHNLYGELIGELGLASFVWFYWMYVVLKRARRLKEGLDPLDPGNLFYINIITAIQLGLVARLLIGNLTHGALFWFWYMMAALTVGVQNVLIKEERFKEEGP
jgi:hypothetical protein